MKITLYTRNGCHLCDVAHAVIERARLTARFDFELVDVDGDAQLRARYGLEVPVVAIDGQPVFRHGVDFDALMKRLT